MVSISHLTVTSTRKLNSLISSNVSSSLRVEVLITNLLAGLERGDYCEMDCSDLDDEPLDINLALASDSKKRQSRYVEEEEEEEEEEIETIELEESKSSGSSLLRRSSPLRQGISRKRPVEEEDEEESDDEEFGWRASPSARERRSMRRNMALEEIQIQVADDDNSSGKPIDTKRSPLVLRLKVPPSPIPESSEEIQTIQVSPPPSEISFFSLNEEVDPFEVLEPPELLEPISQPPEFPVHLGKRRRESEKEEESEDQENEDSGKEMMRKMVDLDHGNQKIFTPPSPLKKQRIEAEVDRKH